jgi:hypothetical protein
MTVPSKDAPARRGGVCKNATSPPKRARFAEISAWPFTIPRRMAMALAKLGDVRVVGAPREFERALRDGMASARR